MIAKERIRAAFTAIGAGRPEAFIDLLAADVVYTLTGTTALSGTCRGRDQLRARVLAPLAARLATPLAFEVDALTAEGERVVVEARARSTLRSGAPYDNRYCFVLRFAGEQVVEVTEYLDTQLVARAFSVPAERADLLRAMDLNLWAMVRGVARDARDGEVRELPGLTLCLAARGQAFHNPVLVRAPLDADTVLAAMRDFHGRRGVPASIWIRAHADTALEAALHARGFAQLASLPGMALLGDPGTPCAPPGLEIRPTVDDAGRRDYAAITAEAYAVYGVPPALSEDLFAGLESVCAPHLQGFVGYVDGRPVAAALVFVSHGVAGINWVGVVTSERGQRFAEAVTWAAVREGFRRGASFANLQASPMGRPVYERMGFTTPTHYRLLVGPS